MLYKAQYNQIVFNGKTMNYLEFGKGAPLVILPGLQDGIAPVHGKLEAIAFALKYKQLARKFRVYVFSRQNSLTEGYTTREMAKDQAEVMKLLGLLKANVIGVSQGGMIAQYIAIDYPYLVDKLILVVTLSKQNQLFQTTIMDWIEMAKREKYKDLIINTTKKSRSEKNVKKVPRIFFNYVGNFNKLRFLIQADSCLKHNSYSEIDKIRCQTLVIGGKEDKVVGSNAAFELAERISSCELFLYEEFGHALYEEAKDFSSKILEFLLK